MDKIKKYLPSKIFIRTIIVAILIIVILLVGYKSINFIKNKISQNKQIAVVESITTGIDDTNKNGISNWEEILWGLDPTKNGPENKDFILAKRESLAKNNGSYDPSLEKNMSTDNKELTKEFFSIIMSLQQSGDLDPNSIQLVSETIGKRIEATPIADTYKVEMIKTTPDSEDSNIAYFNTLNNLLTKYNDEDIGTELTLVSQGLGSNDPQALYALRSIAIAYSSFAEELVKIPTPTAMAPVAVSLANNYDKTGKSVGDLTKLLSDPIVGMRAIINYKKYSEGLVSDLDKLSNVL
jgi:hypothetical protein